MPAWFPTLTDFQLEFTIGAANGVFWPWLLEVPLNEWLIVSPVIGSVFFFGSAFIGSVDPGFLRAMRTGISFMFTEPAIFMIMWFGLAGVGLWGIYMADDFLAPIIEIAAALSPGGFRLAWALDPSNPHFIVAFSVLCMLATFLWAELFAYPVYSLARLLWSLTDGGPAWEWLNTPDGTESAYGGRGKHDDYGFGMLFKDGWRVVSAIPATLACAVWELLQKGNPVPLLVFPLTAAAEQWHRVGDIINDLHYLSRKKTPSFSNFFSCPMPFIP
jgi:hypothetical protein